MLQRKLCLTYVNVLSVLLPCKINVNEFWFVKPIMQIIFKQDLKINHNPSNYKRPL